MAYDNTPGVRATYLDGAFRTPTGSTQPKILVLGTASDGLSYELYNVTNVRHGETEFGADTEVLKGVHESVAQSADNTAIMRIGGRQGALVLTDSAGGTLTIVPEYRDNEIMDRYALIMDGSGTANRVAVWDLANEEWVYDSSEVLVLDEGVVEVTDTGLDLFSVGTIGDTSSYIAFADLLIGDFTVENVATMATAVPTQGVDGQDACLVEKYAALNHAYHLLDYRDADFILPMGVYLDDANVVDSGSTSNFFKGVPVSGDINDELGYVWQYIYRGKLFTYFVDSPTYFTDEPGTASTVTVNTDLVLTALKTGVGGDGISIEIDDTGVAGPTVTISEPTATTLKILVVDDGSSDTTTTVGAINTALGLFTTANGVLADTLVLASGGSVAVLTTVAETPLAGGAGGHVLTHEDLTGDTIPADVVTEFTTNGQDAQLREVNFGHQLATFCERASTTWRTMLGAVSMLGPDALSRSAVADWIGSAAIYTIAPDGQDKIIDAPADNGTGVLGNKFLAGLADSSGGYRNAAIADAASATDGLAYGGFIKTKGLSLPNGNDFPDHSYGVDSADELTDANRAPYDIGKHIFCTYDWPIHRNSFNGGTNYRGSINAALLGKLATMPENEEPIGPNGRIVNVTAAPRVHATQLDQLAQIRAIGLRREEGVGYIFVTAKTAAHPNSDYTRVSTIRSVNRELNGLRQIAKQYIGKDFSAQRLIALQSAMDVFLQGERQAGFNGGAQVGLSYTRNDKILGRLKIKLRMVPPFAIEAIDIETSLAADESEL